VRTPSIFVAYASSGAGLRCAVVYLAAERDVYGWYTGPRDDAWVASAFFVIEGFYTNRPARYEAVAQAELHSRWSLDEARRHELAQMQETFAREWLVYRDDPDAAAELEAYAKAELATGEVNLRFERIATLSTLQPNWTYYSPRFERSVLASSPGAGRLSTASIWRRPHSHVRLAARMVPTLQAVGGTRSNVRAVRARAQLQPRAMPARAFPQASGRHFSTFPQQRDDPFTVELRTRPRYLPRRSYAALAAVGLLVPPLAREAARRGGLEPARHTR
jgi:hypothetical protein